MPELTVRGIGQSLGFFAQGGIYASDAAVYESYYHLPPTPVIPVSVAGTDTQETVGGVALEASLDMDMELAMAPDAKALYCYEAGSESSFAGALLDGLTAVADDDKSGTSFIWKLPSYQVFPDGTPIATYNGGSGSYRNVPDESAVGAPLTGVDVYTSDGTFESGVGWYDLGGTSATAPLWTGFAGVVNQQRADASLPVIGLADPLFYCIYDNQVFNNNTTILDFDDVTSGGNGNINVFGSPGYFAGCGCNNVSSLGSLSAAVLMNDIFSAPSRISSGLGPLPQTLSNFQIVSVSPTSVSITVEYHEQGQRLSHHREGHRSVL